MSILSLSQVFKRCSIYSLSSLPLAKSVFQPKENVIPRLKNIFFSSGHIPMDNVYNLKRDVILYTFERSKFFKYLSVFGIAQLGIWIFYAGYLFVNLRDISKSEVKSEEILTESSLWKRINLGDMRYRIISTALSFGIGLGTAVVTYYLPSRILKELILCKGGKVASFVTYGPFGKPSTFNVPLQKLSCVISRDQATSYIPIKIKDKWFFYLVDCKGKFLQPKLFDYTIGTKTV